MLPSEHEVIKWKNKYKVYSVTLGEEVFFFRPMNMGEFRTISLIDDLAEKEHIILTKGILWPTIRELNDLLSGVAERLVSYISTVTNITEATIVKKVGEARDRLGITDNILSLQIEIIKNLNYTPDIVEEMNFDEFIDAVVLAEAVIGRSLIAGGMDDNQSNPSNENSESSNERLDPIELSDMKDMSQHEGVANANAEQLRKYYQQRKRMTRGRSV